MPDRGPRTGVRTTGPLLSPGGPIAGALHTLDDYPREVSELDAEMGPHDGRRRGPSLRARLVRIWRRLTAHG